jgi:outer membrane receptor protein involved in Fe transport
MTSSRLLHALSLVAVLVLLGSSSALAQSGKIRGTVTDADTGEPLPGVNVVIEGTMQGTATNFDGEYSIIGLRPDTYTVVFSFVGYQTTSVEDLRVSIDVTTDLDVEMAEEVFEGEEIVVTAVRPLVQRDLTATTAFVSGDEIQALPVQDFSEVVELQAGVVNGHFRGGRLGEVGYWVDGLPVTDVFDGGLGVSIENNVVQEAQVVTGAFNAEYGQALSGIVNVVTKDGGDEFEGSFSGFLGDYVAQQEELASGTPVFPALDDLSATAVRNAEGSLGGPILKDRLYFFTSGRYFANDGWIFGRDVFRAEDVGVDSTGRVNLVNPGGSGDSSSVSLNPYEKVTGQAKLTARLGKGMRLAANVLLSQEDFRNFGLDLFYFPTAQRQQQRDAYSAYLKWTHTLSNATFYEAGITNSNTTFSEFLFEDPFDQRYREPEFFDFTDPLRTSNFKVGGTDNRRFERSTNTWLGKVDVTSQVGDANLVKAGIEGRYHTIDFADEFVVVLDEDGTTPQERGQFLADNGAYSYNPIEFSAYVQDKVELGGLIINAGLRFDYFDSNGRAFRDPRDPSSVFLENRIIQRDADGEPILGPDEQPLLYVTPEGQPDFDAILANDYYFEDAESTWQISPRLGVAFPITEGGVVHFSYGQFFQVPNFELLYQNPYFLLGTGGSGLIGLIGNANLKPEQTISGEIGLKQALTPSSAVELTAFYRNIRNLTGTATDPTRVAGSSARYGILVNSDFGFVRGFIARFDQRFGDNLFAGIDYTFQVARANSSDPDQAYNAAAANGLIDQQIVPTNWDQRHTVTASLTYENPRLDAGFGFLMSYGSGEPYTPARTTLQTGTIVPTRIPLNSELKPTTVTVNLNAYKNLTVVGEHTVRLFATVDNLLDARNEFDVFGDTGRATYSLQQAVDASTFRGDDGFLNRNYANPGFFAEPRRVVIGLRYNF